MSFYVLYVENDPLDQKKVKEAIIQRNCSNLNYEPIEIEIIDSPDFLMEALNPKYDIIIADVMYNDPSTGSKDTVDRLNEIIQTVKEWTQSKRIGRTIPIIVYTGTGKYALERCLKIKNELYDIWDKNTASPTYVSWRLSLLALEFSRIRPDALLQRLIHQMNQGASWHNHVVEMAIRYDKGWSEQDQIHGAGQKVQDILHNLEVWSECSPFWESIGEWEALGRAVSRRTRGHARHVINVFWLGYYLIHHPLLKDYFLGAWRNILNKRFGPGNRDELNSLGSISNCWFFTGLFHDMANCVEKYPQVFKFTNKVLGKFKFLLHSNDFEELNLLSRDISRKADRVWNLLGNSLTRIFEPQWEKSIKSNKPDHGMLAAIELSSILENNNLFFIANEASRAISVHNLINETQAKNIPEISWEEEPLLCLLILCDQIQTWDRERDDRKLDDQEDPERAELIRLDIENNDFGKTTLQLAINYIGPRYLDNVPEEIYNRIKDALEYILKDKPNRALNKIRKPWPFNVQIKCYLNGSKLSTDMSF